jgi:hypothetical protein
MTRDFADFLDALNKEGASYLVIGGMAVLAHVPYRTTRDIDVLIEPSLENARKVRDAVRHWGGFEPAFTPEEFISGDVLSFGGLLRVEVHCRVQPSLNRATHAWSLARALRPICAVAGVGPGVGPRPRAARAGYDAVMRKSRPETAPNARRRRSTGSVPRRGRRICTAARWPLDMGDRETPGWHAPTPGISQDGAEPSRPVGGIVWQPMAVPDAGTPARAETASVLWG